jgi:hypothetical protein
MGVDVEGEVEEQLGGVDPHDPHAPFGQAIADASVPARSIEHGIAGSQTEEPDDSVGVAVALLVGELGGIEVEVVLAEGRLEVEPHAAHRGRAGCAEGDMRQGIGSARL